MTNSCTAPAITGLPLDQVDTPALLLDLDKFEHNRKVLRESLKNNPVDIRPHAKSHKCPKIAHLQIGDGAVGICCQKVSEAEIMAKAGVKDILISNQIVGDIKINRLSKLAKLSKITVCVDDLDNVLRLDKFARESKSVINVLIEIEVGTGRCGVLDPNLLISLAKNVSNCENLCFVGLQAYQGRAQHVRKKTEREKLIDSASKAAKKAKTILEDNYLDCKIITGGGTGTYLLEAASSIYTEIQPGSYIFMDNDYDKNEYLTGDPNFVQSLFILSTVMSRPNSERAILDAGLKSIAVDSGLPVTVRKDIEYTNASDEHGILQARGASNISLGQKVLLIPGHCDPTVNLHDWIITFRKNVVEDIWPIEARGASF